MRELNLLPQDSNPSVNNSFIRISLSIGFGGMLIFLLLHEILFYFIKNLENQVATLQVEVDRFTRMQKLTDFMHAPPKDELLLAQAVRYQTETALFWQSIQNEKRDDLCLMEVKRKRNSVLFSGYTENPIDLSDYLTQGSLTQRFSEMTIDSLHYEAATALWQFRIRGNEKIIFNLMKTAKNKRHE